MNPMKILGPCGKCKFWQQDNGICHYYPPTESRWSVTKEDDWCGKWEKETRTLTPKGSRNIGKERPIEKDWDPYNLQK